MDLFIYGRHDKVFLSFMFGCMMAIPETIFCAAVPIRQPKQDLTDVEAALSPKFNGLFMNLRDKIKGALNVQMEERGPRTARFATEVIKGVDGSQSGFKTSHQEYRAGKWQSTENKPHLSFKAIPRQFENYLDKHLTTASCSNLKIPQFRISGLKIFKGINQPDRAYIVISIESCDQENDFETLAATIDSLLPAIPRDIEFKSHITLATIIPLSYGREHAKYVITDNEIRHWQQQLDRLWNQMKRSFASECYNVDHLYVSYWAPTSDKDAQDHGINMTNYVSKKPRPLCYHR